MSWQGQEPFLVFTMSRPAPMSVILNRLIFTNLSNSGFFVNLDPLPQEEKTDAGCLILALKRVFQFRGTMTGGWRKLYNQELHELIHLQR